MLPDVLLVVVLGRYRCKTVFTSGVKRVVHFMCACRVSVCLVRLLHTPCTVVHTAATASV
jgi:hypothetical protein